MQSAQSIRSKGEESELGAAGEAAWRDMVQRGGGH